MNTIRHLDLTVIMPVAPGANPKPAIEALGKSIPKRITAELITVTGTHPTRQRNLAAFRAHGRILWFLDHDAIPDRRAAARLLAAFRDPRVAVAGGPNLAAPARTLFERQAADAIGSMWGSPFVRDRYRSQGGVRQAGEHSLILCNLMIRRDDLLAVGGFDPRLYPNEENALMNQVSGSGRILLHIPGAVVTKGRPSGLCEFMWEAIRYGRGRAEQIWIAPVPGDILYGAAAILCAALLAAGVMYPWHALGIAGFLGITRIRRLAFLLPTGWGFGAWRLAAYASGLMWGLITGWSRRRLQLVALPASFTRLLFRSGSFRMSESSSFDLGSITMKGAFRHA